jgi:hypothetical protein
VTAAAVVPLGTARAEAAVTRTTIVRLCGDLQADAATSADGLVRGFVNGSGSGCTRRIWYFRGSGSSWFHLRTPYVGAVVATANDTTGTYVLFSNSLGLHVGKFTSAGVFRPTVRLSRITTTVGGDIVATGGRWWAVWPEPVGQFGTDELFQSKTIGADVSRQRITRNALPDILPSLTLPSGRPTLVWQRNDSPVEPDNTDVIKATFVNGRWSPVALLTRGQFNSEPAVSSSGRRIDIGWIRDSAASIAESTGGRYSVHVFPRPEDGQAVSPRVGTRGSTAYLGWIAAGGVDESILLATRRSGTWSTRTINVVGPAGAGQQRLDAIAPSARGVRVVFSVARTLFATTIQ